jgi:hypothetical protein
MRDAQRPRGSYSLAHLRGVVARNGAERFQLYVATRLVDQWHNLQLAHDRDRIPFEVHKVSRKRQCAEPDECVYYEHIAVAIGREFLQARTTEDVELTIDGPGGAIRVVIPKEHTKGFLERFDRERLALHSGSAGAPQGAQVSYCEAKYAGDARALSFCQKEAIASYERVAPVIRRARQDSFTREAKVLESCMRQHNGRQGVDWMMVEHCIAKRTSRNATGGPASGRD